MIGIFGRKKGQKKAGKRGEHEEEDAFIEMLSMKIKDTYGKQFGEVVSADENFIVIKHQGRFYSIPSEGVQDRFGDLMLTGNVDLHEALIRGGKWKDTGKEVIGENTFYDFTEKKLLEQERKKRIIGELERARDLTLQTRIEPVPEEAPDKQTKDVADGVSQEETGGEESIDESIEEPEGTVEDEAFEKISPMEDADTDDDEENEYIENDDDEAEKENKKKMNIAAKEENEHIENDDDEVEEENEKKMNIAAKEENEYIENDD